MIVWKCKSHTVLKQGDKLFKYYPDKLIENMTWILEIANDIKYTFSEAVYSKNYKWTYKDFTLVDIPGEYLTEDENNPYYFVTLKKEAPDLWISEDTDTTLK